MRKTFKWVVSIILLAPILLFIANEIHVGVRLFLLNHADHPRILAACREAIVNRKSYRDDRSKMHAFFDENVVPILSPMPDALPAAICKLKPRVVLIHADYVIIDMNLPFQRIGLLGFRPGAKQFGTKKYVDGLWFWNGDDNSKTESK